MCRCARVKSFNWWWSFDFIDLHRATPIRAISESKRNESLSHEGYKITPFEATWIPTMWDAMKPLAPVTQTTKGCAMASKSHKRHRQLQHQAEASGSLWRLYSFCILYHTTFMYFLCHCCHFMPYHAAFADSLATGSHFLEPGWNEWLAASGFTSAFWIPKPTIWCGFQRVPKESLLPKADFPREFRENAMV